MVAEAIVLWLALCSWRDARVNYWRAQTPEDVPQALADDPQIHVMRLDRLIARQPQRARAIAGEIEGTARSALARDPLDARAMWELGLASAQHSSESGKGRFALSERISRRYLPTQLELVNESARQGSVSAAVAHYNRALAIWPEAGEKLYPVLAQAIVEPAVRSEVVKYSAREWFGHFLDRAVSLGADPAAVVSLFAEARPRLKPDVRRKMQSSLASQLVEQKQFALLLDLGPQVSAIAAPSGSAVGFYTDGTIGELPPLTWRLGNDETIQTFPSNDGSLDLRIAAEQTALAAQRITLLSAGEYVFSYRISHDAGTPSAKVTWVVSCTGGPRAAPLMETSPLQDGGAAIAFTVPRGCPAQSWRLSAAAELAQFPSTAHLAGLSLVKK